MITPEEIMDKAWDMARSQARLAAQLKTDGRPDSEIYTCVGSMYAAIQIAGDIARALGVSPPADFLRKPAEKAPSPPQNQEVKRPSDS